MVQPWVESGYDAILVDPQHEPGVSTDGPITRIGQIIDHGDTWAVLRQVIRRRRIALVAGFPPCTDLAVSGSRWLESKWQADPAFQFKAMQVVWQCQVIGEMSGAPWFAENPVSQISSLWRKPDHSFHPFEFTALESNDNYTKKTCLWVGGGFTMPSPQLLPEVTHAIAIVKDKIGRMVPKSDAIKAVDDPLVVAWYPDDRIHKAPPTPDRANFRSATPLGFARAVYGCNAEL